MQSKLRSDEFLCAAMESCGDAVYRLAYCRLGSRADAEDVFQEVFIRLLRDTTEFRDSEHLKAWLLRVTLSRCADLRRSAMSDEGDLRDAWHARMDEFDGATLTVTVTFTDGAADTQTMTLHTGKLGVEYPSDESGPQLTGEVLTDEQAAEQGYVYGVYAEIEE